MKMKKWLVASIFMLAVQVNAEGMVMIDGTVDTTEIRALKFQIGQLEAVWTYAISADTHLSNAICSSYATGLMLPMCAWRLARL